MRSNLPVIIVLLLTILIGQNTYGQTGKIEGKLYTFGFMFIKWGNPGENKVILQNKTGFQVETFSDKNGKYSFENVPAGNYTISVDCKADLKDLGLCRMTGTVEVTVKSNKTTKADIKVYKM